MLAICNISVYEKDRAIWTSRIHPSNSRIANNWEVNIMYLISKNKRIIPWLCHMFFMIKYPNKSGIEQNYLNLIKGGCKTLTANYTFCGKISHPMYFLRCGLLFWLIKSWSIYLVHFNLFRYITTLTNVAK